MKLGEWNLENSIFTQKTGMELKEEVRETRGKKKKREAEIKNAKINTNIYIITINMKKTNEPVF